MGRTVLGPAPGPARQPVGGELKDFTYTPSVNRTLSQAERVNHFPLYAISLGHALTHWYPATFYLLLPFIAADVGLSYTQVGVLITMRAVSQTLVTLPGGAIVDMVGRRGLVMALALAWSGVPYFFLGLSTNYVVILACMGLMGWEETCGTPRPYPTCRSAIREGVDTLSPFTRWGPTWVTC